MILIMKGEIKTPIDAFLTQMTVWFFPTNVRVYVYQSIGKLWLETLVCLTVGPFMYQTRAM